MSILTRIKRKNDAPEISFGSVTNYSDFRFLNTDVSTNTIHNGELKFNQYLLSITYVQQLYTRSSYKWNDLVFKAKYGSALFTDESRKTGIGITKLSNYIQANQ